MEARERTARRVLIIEDDEDLRESLALLLEARGYEVELARDGLEALELLGRDRDFGLIMLDLMMPRMDGLEFRNRQRADPELDGIPTIVITADWKVDPDIAEIVVTKPYHTEGLLRLVHQHCRQGRGGPGRP